MYICCIKLENMKSNTVLSVSMFHTVNRISKLMGDSDSLPKHVKIYRRYVYIDCIKKQFIISII